MTRKKRSAEKKRVKGRPNARQTRDEAGQQTLRGRIVHAAFTAFVERGYAKVSTLEIARLAKTSKRELYALFGSKHAILVSCITERTNRMRQPLELPAPRNREALAATLVNFGSSLLAGVCNPVVTAVYRLAIAEPEGSARIGKTLDANGRGINRRALASLFAQAQADGLLGREDPLKLTGQFLGLLWDDTLIRLLLRVTTMPSPEEINRKAHAATQTLLALYPPPNSIPPA
jgi:AcrR family transcriptional regulator